MEVQIIQVPYDSSHRDVRMGSGPLHFIRRGLAQALEQESYDVLVDTVEPDSAFRAEIKTAFELYRRLAERVRAARESKRFPLVLSGNCNSSLGTIAGLGAQRLGVVWFDGHGDFNTPETSASGFLDGMGLATAVGLCWKALAFSIPGFAPVPGPNVIHVGSRDFSSDEAALFDQAGVQVLTARDIERGGLRVTFGPALAALRARADRLYLHFDLDVLDPEVAKANEFAPPDGLTVEQVEEAVALAGASFSICAGAVASYDPRFDEDGRAAGAGTRIIRAVLKAARSYDCGG
jgi:arginase